MPSVEPHELDAYLGPKNHQNPSSEHDNNRALMNNLSMKTVVKQKQLQSNTRQIELSQSVGIGLPLRTVKPSHQIAIVNQLEELFRPRYKSDYISQNGKIRKPRVYLVLIKSKQDELKFLQPLKPFHPFQDVFGIFDKNNTKQISSLNPKLLIAMYQLDKSQLAFTYCALGSDGETWIPEWDTTVYSTVITEMQPDNSKQKAVKCPNCTHVFQTTMGAAVDDIQVTVTNKRKANRHANQQAVKIPKSA